MHVDHRPDVHRILPILWWAAQFASLHSQTEAQSCAAPPISADFLPGAFSYFISLSAHFVEICATGVSSTAVRYLDVFFFLHSGERPPRLLAPPLQTLIKPLTEMYKPKVHKEQIRFTRNFSRIYLLCSLAMEVLLQERGQMNKNSILPQSSNKEWQDRTQSHSPQSYLH